MTGPFRGVPLCDDSMAAGWYGYGLKGQECAALQPAASQAANICSTWYPSTLPESIVLAWQPHRNT